MGIGNENNNNRRRGNNDHNNNGGGRGGVYAVFLIVAVMFLLSESGLRLAEYAVTQAETTLGVVIFPSSGEGEPEEKAESQDGRDAEELAALRAISEHCLPKLVCELFTREARLDFTPHETHLVDLIGATQLSAAGPSKYHYAAHMGQLIRGFEGGGCHHFFPACPFSAHDVRQIARRLKVGS